MLELKVTKDNTLVVMVGGNYIDEYPKLGLKTTQIDMIEGMLRRMHTLGIENGKFQRSKEIADLLGVS